MVKYQSRFQMMGTFIDLLIYHRDGEKLIKEIYHLLNQYSERFTVNQPQSELMSINKNAGIYPVPVKRDLFQLIKTAKAISEERVNPFNIAIGPLVKTWRIGFKDANVPTQEEISAKLSLVAPKNIILDEQVSSVFLSRPEMEIDLGAIAKGYFADEVKKRLVNNGVKSGIINLGGNVLTIGHSPENPLQVWTAGIQNPLAARGTIIRAIRLKDTSIVTSGINERFFHANGQLYHHLLDSRTGMPISTDIASITIISQHSVDGEIWSTAGFLSTVADSICYLNKQDNIEAVIISKNGSIHLTHGLADNGSYIYPTNRSSLPSVGRGFL
ncbi:MAG: thiamine biosynthesis lipoprotein [Moritella dasanensis]|jgi:thiamine biosynthesis lipoprotein